MVKRNSQWLLLVGILFIVLILWAGHSKAETKVGFDWQYGKDYILLSEAWQSPDCINTVNRFSVRAETNDIPLLWGLDLLGSWYYGAEFQYSVHKADERPTGEYGIGHDAGFKEYSFNLTIKRQMFDDLFYLGLLAGMSYWHERDHGMHDLGDSHWLGTWGGMLGRDWNIYKAWSVRSELRMTHTSDPFRTNDKGKNYLSGVVGLSYRF